MSQFTRACPGHRQAGLSLIVAMIMLLMMTMTALMLFRMSNTGTQIVGNMQFQNEALTSANGAIQEVISTTRMFLAPTQVFLEACNGSFNRRCYDINGDGQNDLQVDVTPPTCVQVDIKPNATLNLTTDEKNCAIGVTQTFGVEGASEGNSLCSETVWEVQAVASDFGASGATGASVSLVEGVGVQVRTGTALTFCFGP